MHYIYALLKNNGKVSFSERVFYIGQTCRIKSRMEDHRRLTDSNSIKNNIIKKYSFDYIVLYEFETIERANEMETFLIRFIGKIKDKKGPLANIENGGSGISKKRFSKIEKDNIIDEFINSGELIGKFSKKFEISHHTLSKWLADRNKTPNRRKYDEEFIDYHTTNFIDSSLTTIEYARQNNIDIQYWQNFTNKKKIKSKFVKIKNVNEQLLLDKLKDKIVRMCRTYKSKLFDKLIDDKKINHKFCDSDMEDLHYLIKKEIYIYELCYKFNISKVALMNRFKKYCELKNINYEIIKKCMNDRFVSTDKEKLIIELKIQGLSDEEIVRKLKTSKSIVRRLKNAYMAQHPEMKDVFYQEATEKLSSEIIDKIIKLKIDKVKNIEIANQLCISVPVINKYWKKYANENNLVLSVSKETISKIIPLLQNGFTAREVADKLGITTRTVHSHQKKYKESNNEI